MDKSKQEEVLFLEQAFTTLDNAEGELKLLGNKISDLNNQIKELRTIRDSFVGEKEKVEETIKHLVIKLQEKVGIEKVVPDKKLILKGETKTIPRVLRDLRCG